MSIPATVNNIAENAWPLIRGVSSMGGKPLTTHLGKGGTGIIARHFPTNWLNDKKAMIMPTVATPDLNGLWKRMKYKSLQDFKAACDRTNKDLFRAVANFSQGGATFLGITYDKTIILKKGFEKSLDLILHELVHTLQWAKYGPEEFLRRYIQGYVNAKLVYKNNPAERVAYGFEDKFRVAVSSEFKKSKKQSPVQYKYSVSNMKNILKVSDDEKVAESLKGTKSLGITKTRAAADMYSL